MECVLRKIGVDDVEFTMATGSGRVHLYRANGAYAGCSKRNADGSCKTKTSTSLATLFTGTNIDRYDIGIFDCEGSANEDNTYDPKLETFAEAGGRVFASHFRYTYLDDNGNFGSTATWGGPHHLRQRLHRCRSRAPSRVPSAGWRPTAAVGSSTAVPARPVPAVAVVRASAERCADGLSRPENPQNSARITKSPAT